MSRYYGQPIQAPGATDGGQPPRRFTWRGRTLVVADLLSAWHLRDRWWAAPDAPMLSGAQGAATQASDRSYYRLACVGGLQCDVYYDAALNQWFLDRVYD